MQKLGCRPAYDTTQLCGALLYEMHADALFIKKKEHSSTQGVNQTEHSSATMCGSCVHTGYTPTSALIYFCPLVSKHTVRLASLAFLPYQRWKCRVISANILPSTQIVLINTYRLSDLGDVSPPNGMLAVRYQHIRKMLLEVPAESKFGDDLMY